MSTRGKRMSAQWRRNISEGVKRSNAARRAKLKQAKGSDKVETISIPLHAIGGDPPTKKKSHKKPAVAPAKHDVGLLAAIITAVYNRIRGA